MTPEVGIAMMTDCAPFSHFKVQRQLGTTTHEYMDKKGVNGQ